MPTTFEDVIEPGEGIEERLNILQVGFNAQRCCKVAWDDRWTFINEKILTAWPYHSVNAYCIEGRAKPFPGSKTKDGDGGLLDFDHALVTLSYTSNIFSVSSGVIGWERLRGAMESVPVVIKANTLFWQSAAGTAVANGDAPSYISFPGMMYERGYHGLSAIPAAAATLIGCVNHAALASVTLGVTFPAETIRYVDFAADRNFTPSGSAAWKLVYYHHYKPNVDSGGTARGWNWFWRPEACDFQPVYDSAGDQYKPHFTANLTTLYS